MRQKNLVIAIAIVSIMLCLSIGGTLAFWVVESRAINQIDTGTLKGILINETEPNDSLYPGDVVPHLVSIKNEGTLAFLARLKVEKSWASGLDASNVNIEYNNKYWMDGGDGYFYYKAILEPGKTAEEPLFTEFELDKSTNNDYGNDDLKIKVDYECIQATNNAISVKWNKTYQDIGVSAPSQPQQAEAAKVNFVSPDNKFEFDNNSNLFAGFSKLTPGDKRSQVINVKNSYNETIQVFIRAEQVNQNATGQQLQQLNELLQQHAKITVRNQSGQTLYNGAIWGNYTTEPSGNNSMKKNISLGNIAANSNTDVTVDLELAPEIENEYQGLLGNIRWVFTAEGGEVDVTPTTPPGDKTTPRPTGVVPTPTPTPGPTGSTTPRPTPTGTGLYPTSTPSGGGSWTPKPDGPTPGTGVYSAMPWMLMGIVALTCVLLGLIIAYKKQKARDNYNR